MVSGYNIMYKLTGFIVSILILMVYIVGMYFAYHSTPDALSIGALGSLGLIIALWLFVTVLYKTFIK